MNTPKIFTWGLSACAVVAGTFFFVNPNFAQGQKPENIVQQAEKLIKDGNYKEAKDKVTPYLTKADPSVPPEAVAELMQIGYQALNNLGQPQELDEFLESTIKAHPENWRALRQAGQWLLASGGVGSIMDGKFVRQRWDGQRADSRDRDRVQALIWIHKAGETVVKDVNASGAERANVLLAEARLWLQNRAAWQLQSLTNLETLPEIEIMEGGRGRGRYYGGYIQSDTGYPSDAEGNPVYFKLPATWEAAANDGERWRYLLKRASDTDAASASQATLMFAQQLSHWLDVTTLQGSPIWPLIVKRDEDGTQGDVNKGIVDLPSLKENETITRLATGIKRHTLPDEFDYMGMLKELSSEDNEFGNAALSLRATIFENRRQRKQAVEAWQQLVDRDKKKNTMAKNRLEQIVGKLGKLEPQETQTAGTAAKVSVVFRNAEAVSFTARPIKVDKLMERVREDYRDLSKGKKVREQREWHWLTQVFGTILQGQNNIKKGEVDKFLGEVVADWNHELQPAADHADRRVMLDTPLRDAGVYLVEAKFKDGNSTRTIIELVDLISFMKPRLDAAGQWGFVTDASTGAPVANAEINAFGYRSEYQDRRNQPRQVWYITEQNLRSDEKGGFVLGLNDQERHQWLLEVKAADGRTAVLGLQYYYWAAYNRNREDYEQQRVFVATDRPVYRPNQKVYLNAWARRATYKEGSSGNEFADRRFTVQVHNPRGEKLLEQQGSLDAEGAASIELSLAENAALGAYSIHWQIDEMQSSGSGSFRVEEYKKPEFEVTVKTPDKPILLGEAFKATVEAKYYFGGAVTDAQVHYKVERTIHETSWFPVRPWDWLYGPGYWWRNYDYHWLNGYSKCISIAPPWWPRSFDPPEVVAEATVPIGPDGKLEIPLDSALAKELHGDKDHRYQITAEVVDSSRRMIVGTGSVVAPLEPYKVYVWMDRGYYQPGAEANLTFTARTPDSQPVKGKAKVKVYSVTYGENQEPKEEVQGTFDLEGKDDQSGKQRLQFPKAGQYRLEVLFTDDAGHEVQGTAYTSVRGDADDKQNNGKDLRFPDLEVIAEKTEYQPGEEASFLINTDQEGATLLIFERPLNGAYNKPKQVTLAEGKSTNFKLKLDSEDQPNVFLEVVTVHHGKVHSQVVQVPVPPAKRIADVELTPSNETYKPQAEGNIQIKVTRPDGKPVEGRVLLTGYDKALEYISGGSNIPEIRDFFWGWKRHHNPQLISSLQTIRPYISQEGTQWQPIGVFGNNDLYFGAIDDRSAGVGGARSRSSTMALDAAAPASPAPMAAAAPADGFAPAEAPASRQMAKAEMSKDMEAQSGAAPAEAETMIRQDFADLLIWNSMAKTNDRGIASIPLKFPDDLTTWKLKAWVLGPNSEVGEAQVEVITRKDLLVRLQAPRFFVEKDEVVISGIVHNDHKDAQQVRAVLELDGKTLAPVDATTVEQRSEVKSHDEHRFDWRVRVLAEGEAKIRVKALAAAESDAVEKTFPVFVHGMERQDAWSLAVSPDQAEGSVTFNVPDKRRPAQTRLEVRYSPSLAAAMVDALPFLISYPHGCTEQTLNRFVPTVITQSVLKDLGLDLKAIRDKRNNLNAQELGDPKRRAEQWKRWKDQDPVFNAEEMQKMVSAGIQRLQSMQSADGGWGWWPGASEGSPHITAQVIEGLLQAKSAGTDVPQDVINAGLQWLEQYEARQLQRLALPKEDNQHKPWPDNIDALVHHILVTAGQGNDNMRKQLFEHRLKLSKATQARVGEACHLKGEAERSDMIVRNLEQYQKVDPENQTAWLDFGKDHYWWYWYDDDIETIAAYLKLRVTRDAKDKIAPQLVKYLLNNRKNGSYWRSTRDTAAAISALATYLKASNELAPDMLVELWLDGKKLKEVTINKDNLFSYDHSLVLSGEELTGGDHKLEIKRKGGGTLYANVYLSCFTLEDHLRAAGLEVKVQRNLYKLVPEETKDLVAGAQGQALSQKGSRYKREPLPAEAKVVSGDLIEVELITESKNDYEYLMLEDFKPAGCEALDLQSGYVWDQGLNAYREFRDEKVSYYIENLPHGKNSLTYRLRAEIPGQFSALPSVISGMYAPELKGNSEEKRVSITDAAK